MNVRAGFRKANLIQQAHWFKVTASMVVVVLAMGLYLASVVAAHKAGDVSIEYVPPAPAEGQAAPDLHPDIKATIAIVNDVLKERGDPTNFGISMALLAGLALGAIWLGLGLTFLGLGAGAIALTRLATAVGMPGEYVPLLLGGTVLTAAFLVLMALARLLTTYSLWLLPMAIASTGAGVLASMLARSALAGSNAAKPGALMGGLAVGGLCFVASVRAARTMRPGPVAAIARTVLSEAARLRLSVLFVVALIFLMAALPELLDNGQLLRYRVQSFLQYGTGGTFWLIAVLVLAFAVATVAFDQRDKTIWQTMTKPVSAGQYIAGKWLGVTLLGGVLLAVSATGVFMFTEYLRAKPARGEGMAYIAADGQAMSDDRMILETQVLAARAVRVPERPEINEEQFEANVLARAEQILIEQQIAAESPEQRDARRAKVISKVREDLRKLAGQIYYTIPPGERQSYRFTGLGVARDQDRPLMLRFKLNAGGNAPDSLLRVTFEFHRAEAAVQLVHPGQFTTLKVLPAMVDEQGAIELAVWNGDTFRREPNAVTMQFPPDGLEISYSAGSFRANFARVMAVLWVKLAFLAMLGVVTATFLSFPVACLVSFATFMAAEGATFVQGAMENYWTEDREGKRIWFNTIIAFVAERVSGFFEVYSDLRPTARLVEGLRLSPGEAGWGVGVLTLWTLLLYVGGVIVLRRRELATYSGH